MYTRHGAILAYLVFLFFAVQATPVVAQMIEVDDRGELEGQTLQTEVPCETGSVFFDGVCRGREFFKDLVADGATLVTFQGCPAQSLTGDNGACGTFAFFLERLDAGTTRQIMLVVPGDVDAGTAGQLGRGTLVNATDDPRYGPALVASDLKRGAYDVARIRYETAATLDGKTQEVFVVNRYFEPGRAEAGADSTLLVYGPPEGPGGERAVAGRMCFRGSGLKEQASDPGVGCTCREEGRCLSELDRGAEVVAGQAVECLGERCSLCSRTAEDSRSWSELDLTLTRQYALDAGAAKDGFWPVKRSFDGCYTVDGVFAAKSLTAYGDENANGACNASVADVSKSTSVLCLGLGVMAGTGAFAFGALNSVGGEVGFPGGVTMTGINGKPLRMTVAYDMAIAGAENATWAGGGVYAWCNGGALLSEISLIDSACNTTAGSCTGRHENQKIQFAYDGKVCEANATLVCQSDKVKTAFGAADCNCDVELVDVLSMSCG